MPGEVVHINVFDAPDFSITTSVSEGGDVPFPILGSFPWWFNHLDSCHLIPFSPDYKQSAGKLITTV